MNKMRAIRAIRDKMFPMERRLPHRLIGNVEHLPDDAVRCRRQGMDEPTNYRQLMDRCCGEVPLPQGGSTGAYLFEGWLARWQRAVLEALELTRESP
jgi:hypothetical protein